MLALRMGGKEGASQFQAPPGSFPSVLRSSLLSHLSVHKHLLPRGKLQENEFRRHISGQKSSDLLAVGPMFFWGA